MDKTYEDRVSLSENPTRFIKKRVSEVTSPTLDTDDSSPYGSGIKLKPALLTSVVAGGIAGVVVDISLYPLDTIKTRLQSKVGFTAAGGFRGIYKGVIPVLLCSAPLSALFFATYNTLVNSLKTTNKNLDPLVYIVSASAAELVTSIFRVPLEIVKQRKQTSNSKSLYIIRQALGQEGIHGLYRGFWSTMAREIPFAAIQYPLWEVFINQAIEVRKDDLTSVEIAFCGAAAGAIAAASTTPMDVIKTRIMLEEKEKIDKIKKNVNIEMAKQVHQQRGFKGLFAGVVPRVLWITLGGFIYFGAYEKTKSVFEERCRAMAGRVQTPTHDVAPSYLEEKIEKFLFSQRSWCDLTLSKSPVKEGGAGGPPSGEDILEVQERKVASGQVPKESKEDGRKAAWGEQPD